MVWAYLSGLSNAEEKEERNVNYVFGSTDFGKYNAQSATISEAATLKAKANTKNEADKRAATNKKKRQEANLKKARQDEKQKVNGRVSSRVRQLRAAAEKNAK